MAMLMIHPTKVDPSKAVDVILESELNRKVFKTLMKSYNELWSGYVPPKIEEPIFPEGLSEEDKSDLALGRYMRNPERFLPAEMPFKTLQQMSKLVEESDLEALERSLDAFSTVHLVGIYRNREKNKLYSVPAKGHFYTKDNKIKTFGFEEYIGMIKDRFDLFA